MLINELIVRHLGPQGSLHERGIQLNRTQVPPGVHVHHEGGDDVTPAAGDLLLVSAPAGAGLREHVDTDLPVDVTLALLLTLEVAELPVGRVLAALAAAKLQVVEAAVVSGAAVATVAVVATRTDDLVAPKPSLANLLEPGNHDGPAVLRRVLGEHALEGLVQRARERNLSAQLGENEARLGELTSELEQLRADRRDYEAMVRDRDTARSEADTERKRIWSLVKDLEAARKEIETARKALESARREIETARKEADTERKRMRMLRSSKSFKVASRLARMSGVARRITRQSK